MTGGFTFNNLVKKAGFKGKSPRTLEEMANVSAGAPNVFKILTANITGPILNGHFAFIGGINNPTKTIVPIDSNWLNELNSKTNIDKYKIPLLQLLGISSENNIGVFMKIDNEMQIIPIGAFPNMFISKDNPINNIGFNNLNGTPINSEYLTRELVKESNEGHRKTGSSQESIKYLYVIGRKQNTGGNTIGGSAYSSYSGLQGNSVHSHFGNGGGGLYQGSAFGPYPDIRPIK